ncbi:MexE family multidrug efflux RND transporter periplasmic adaptor subunit [Campylobacterota bacterium]|nr:MexE family multidrug efflux RND transporter periplasmic adaptor subunit [Campylobacterota bacterium]
MRRSATVVLASLLTILMIGCGEPKGQQEAAAAQAAARPPMPVTVFTAQSEDLYVTLEYPAKLASSGFVEVRSKVSGALLSREYREGSGVLNDALLFVIDPAKYKAAKDAAQAAFNQADREYKRLQKLFANNAVSERDRDAALAAYESTRAALNNAVLDLDYTSVKAPISGFAGTEAQNVGNLISTGTLLTTITKVDPLHAEFAFSNIEKLRADYVIEGEGSSWANPLGIKVRVRGEDGVTFPNEGRIDFIDASIDRNTGSVKARAVIPNSRGLLLPGQYVRVVLGGIIKKNAVQIPSQALMHGPNGAFVYLAQDGKAALQPVKIANETTGFFIIHEGLKSGDQIITNNLTKLRPGAPVMVVPSASAQGK